MPSNQQSKSHFQNRSQWYWCLGIQKGLGGSATVSRLLVAIFRMQGEFPMYGTSLSSKKAISLLKDCVTPSPDPLTRAALMTLPSTVIPVTTELSHYPTCQKMEQNATEDRCLITRRCSDGFPADTFFRDLVYPQPQKTFYKNQTCFLCLTQFST